MSSTGPIVEVALRPGVTDPVAGQILHAAHILGLAGVQAASTGLRFALTGAHLTPETLDLLSRRLLSNAVIQRYALGEIEPAFPEPAQASGRVAMIAIREMDPAQLLACSSEHRAALDLAEMQAIQAYFQRAGRDCSDVEFECIAQTWSEHCVHKTFKALITVEDPRPATKVAKAQSRPAQTTVDNILNTYIRSATDEIAAPWVISAFSDNAGIIDFDDEYEVSFKVETHNHPSAIEPFGGANTGVGGVIRDVMGVSAKPIANTDVLCFGPADLPLAELPEGVLHPRRIQSGVVAGVQDYGNKMGIPTVNGAIWYDPGFTANPLVFCGCVGLAPRGKHVHTPQVDDRVIVLGGRTGRDGLRGATFSSMTMDAQTGEVAGAPSRSATRSPKNRPGSDPDRPRRGPVSRHHRLRRRRAFFGRGRNVQQMRRRYRPGQGPAQIPGPGALGNLAFRSPGAHGHGRCSGPAAAPAGHLRPVRSRAHRYWHSLPVRAGWSSATRLSRSSILKINSCTMACPSAAWRPARPHLSRSHPQPLPHEVPLGQTLLDLLAHPNIASKAATIRIYDHEVQGGTRVKPLTGVMNDGPSDACVIKPSGTQGIEGHRAFERA